jgi:hypothetical protein
LNRSWENSARQFITHMRKVAGSNHASTAGMADRAPLRGLGADA